MSCSTARRRRSWARPSTWTGTGCRRSTPSVDVDGVRAALVAIEAVCDGEPRTGPCQATRGERFRWLAAPRSTVVQPGPMHGGLTDDPAAELGRLLDRLVR